MGLKQKLDNFREEHKEKKWYPVFGGFHTFLYTPKEVTHNGTHIKGADDLKRTMNTVVMALIPCLIFGMFNAGYQHHIATGEVDKVAGFFCGNFWNFSNLWVGLIKVLPLVIVSYIVGLTIEFIFCVIKGHEIEEGYLVTGMLVPLIVPIDTPLWMLTIAIAFGVVIGKEVFGGTGMNILNPALTIRAFLFFAYPTWMSGDKVWVHGADPRMNMLGQGNVPDAISGETVLGSLAQSQDLSYSALDMFFGFIPGSVGETSTRIMLSSVIGALVMGFIFNAVVDAGVIGTTSKFYGLMSLDFWKHLLIGGFAFGAVYMATDPVTASQTNKGKWIYGFLIGLD